MRSWPPSEQADSRPASRSTASPASPSANLTALLPPSDTVTLASGSRAGFRLLGAIQEVCRHHPQGTCWCVQSHTLGEGSVASQLSRIRFQGLTLSDPGSPGFGGNRPAAASGYGFFPLLSDRHCSVDGLQAGGGCGSL